LARTPEELVDRQSLPFSKEHGEKIKRGLVSISPCFFLWIGRVAKPWTGFACAGALADGSDPRAVCRYLGYFRSRATDR
jgi:hypothetical protein